MAASVAVPDGTLARERRTCVPQQSVHACVRACVRTSVRAKNMLIKEAIHCLQRQQQQGQATERAQKWHKHTRAGVHDGWQDARCIRARTHKDAPNRRPRVCNIAAGHAIRPLSSMPSPPPPSPTHMCSSHNPRSVQTTAALKYRQ